MNITEKLGSLMARPNEDLVDKDDVPKMLKYGGRILGAVGGGIAIFFGIWAATGIILANVSCLIGGVWQMIAGFIVLSIEAPCCCMFIDYVSTIAEFADRRPYWNRAALYCGIAIPPIIMCFGLSTIFGSGLIFGTGVLYGFMAIGKKATAEEMQSAVQGGFVRESDKSQLPNNEYPPAMESV